MLGPGFLRTPHTLGEARVLYELNQAPELEVAELRRRMAIDAGQLSRLLARLEGQGLVARERSPADRRRQVARLTPAGAAPRRCSTGARSRTRARGSPGSPAATGPGSSPRWPRSGGCSTATRPRRASSCARPSPATSAG